MWSLCAHGFTKYVSCSGCGCFVRHKQNFATLAVTHFHGFQAFYRGTTDPLWRVQFIFVRSAKSVFTYRFFFFKLTSFIVIPKYCKINNGDCEQFCSIKKSVQKDVMCSCAKGYVLAEDGKHCVSSGTKSHDKLIAILVRLVLVKECVLNHQCCTWHRFKTEANQLVCIFEVFHVWGDMMDFSEPSWLRTLCRVPLTEFPEEIKWRAIAVSCLFEHECSI